MNQKNHANQNKSKSTVIQTAIMCFRDNADGDYISARNSYRTKLIPQFYWAALQAIEKYLKFILFYNGIPIKGIHHDLEALLERSKKLPFSLKLSNCSIEFILAINRIGCFRYLEIPYTISGPKLQLLDLTVWEIRRYCTTLNRQQLDTIQNDDGSKPCNKFHIPNGCLEKILHNTNHPARKPFIWQNGYFGSRNRKTVRMRLHFELVNTPLSLNPSALKEVCELIYLPKEVIKAYERLQKK